MFDQLYVLANGGVCVYSGPPNAISGHLGQVPEIVTSKKSCPIETLIKHSCSGHEDPIVQKLCHVNSKSLLDDDVNLEADAQLAPDGVLANRTRFSLHSVFILSLRYLAYIRGYLWMEWLPFLVLYTIYGLLLNVFFDSSIALSSGCVSIDDDFNNTCSIKQEELEERMNIFANMKYNLFFSNMFVMIVMLQCGLNLVRELDLFWNEQRNGKLQMIIDKKILRLFLIVFLKELTVI